MAEVGGWVGAMAEVMEVAATEVETVEARVGVAMVEVKVVGAMGVAETGEETVEARAAAVMEAVEMEAAGEVGLTEVDLV